MQIGPHAVALLSVFACASIALAQDEIAPTAFDPLVWADVPVSADSGRHEGTAEAGRTAWYTLVQSPGAAWMRLEFGKDTELARELEAAGSGAFIRITSLMDGDEQRLDSDSLSQWSNATAHFNGDALLVELVTGTNPEPSRVRIANVQAGQLPPVEKSQCGSTDDRVAVQDNRVARIVPVGCTGWMIHNDANHQFLTAGHCPAGGSMTTLHFNVPLSSSGGTIVAPAVADQYPIDSTSYQSNNGGVGADWCYFGAFPNSNTGLTAWQAYRTAFDVALPPTSATGNQIRITGFGTDTGTASQTNQTHVGSLVSLTASALRYNADTTGGNSGSPVIWENEGVAIGIHTHGGCTTSGGSNAGTSWLLAAPRNALTTPLGACRAMTFTPVGSLPTRFAAAGGDTIDVTLASPSGAAAPAAARLLYRTEGASTWSSVNGTLVSGTTYRFTTPSFGCGSRVQYAFSARMGSTGGLCTFPSDMPRRWFTADVVSTSLVLWEDTFETSTGWSVSGTATAGAFDRNLPRGNGFQGDPTIDNDGSGQCYLTGRNAGVNVDGGVTILTSPAMDARGGFNPQVSYARWFNCATGSNANQDTMTVEISGDNGANWVTLETVGPTGTSGAWVRRTFAIGDYVTPGAQVRLRFTASDTGAASVVEAAVDGVRILADAGLGWCGKEGDFDQDGIVGASDVGLMLLQWDLPGITDLDGDGTTGGGDLALELLNFD
jgi:V8-like Glu-specific endopeptidase